jgi:malate/lactate dehydrogenase
MNKHESEKSESIQRSVAILYQVLEKLGSREYGIAQVIIGVVEQMLRDVQLELDHQLKLERKLRDLIKR